MPKIIAVDVGGTFTDIVEYAGGSVTGRKVPTSRDQSESVASTVDGRGEDTFLHGTTAATNALLEGRGAEVALVTDEHYEDVIEIGRQNRPSLYDSSIDRPEPLVTRANRRGYSGPDLPEIASTSEIIAVALIESYRDPAREGQLAIRLREKFELPVVLSSDVSPEYREYERIATTVLSAYLTPSVADYLHRLDGRLAMETRLVMTSAGGLIPFRNAPEMAGRLVLSGPAGGTVAAAALGRHHGYDSVLTFDMGGTSTDVARITNGELLVGPGHEVAGRVNRVPSIPIRTIGAGGGSIAWVDSGGALRVGPRSAGSIPGPAAYGLGGLEPTVTDANIVAGRIPAGLALAGTLTLDTAAARSAIAAVGEQVGLGIEETALGMLEVVDSHMEHALRSVSVEEGADPREAVLVAFGGAGGLHAVRLARRLGMNTVLIPPHSGVFSALGLLMAAPRSDASRTVMLNDGDQRLPALSAEVLEEASRRFSETFGVDPVDVSASADVRYRGQSHELEVHAPAMWAQVRIGFEVAHAQMFGFKRESEPIELVNLRAVAVGTPPLDWSALPRPADSVPQVNDGTWERSTLPPGFTIAGPATVTEANSAVVVEEGSRLTVIEDGTLLIEL
jgi:N-methylhydantoinase A